MDATVDPADLATRLAMLEDLAAEIKHLARSVSLGALDLEPLLLDALDRLERVTSDLRAMLGRARTTTNMAAATKTGGTVAP